MTSSTVKPQTALQLVMMLLQLVVMLLGVLASGTAWACRDLATTPLEQTYCALAERGLTQGLPRFDDFRRNPPATQYLLLKRPADKARLPLQAPASQAAPLPIVASKPAPQSPPNQTRRTPPSQGAVPSPQQHTGTQEPRATASPLSDRAQHASGLADCQLLPLQIVCGRSRYLLHDNRRNSQLDADAFSPQNRLMFPNLTTLDSTVGLGTLYALYLDKMLKIGLGGATLSYRKFEFLYDESKRQQSDFNARFATMYDFLKKDKQAQDADKMHSGKSAPALSDCQSFGTDVIACDAQQGNWVYRRER